MRILSRTRIQGKDEVKDSRSCEVRFTKYASEKFKVLKHYGFEISEEEVVKTIRGPEHVDHNGTQ
ncbi:MAG: hypothetical protein LZ174_03325 [Thaumarchaeota archaeon]|jgi:hypothetical protein|nr:hypothetical protein [Candidatus Geocrenenecus arthurdayi]